MKELVLQNLTYQYGDFTAVEDVSFTLREGEVVGFIGINGAGKSTTLKVLSGIQTDFEGDVFYDGISLKSNPLEYKKNIGYLAENNPLYEDMYIKEFLHFCAGLFQLKDISDRVDVIINQVQLEDHKGKKIKELSKGLRQRVGIAQALIHNPEVLILDEPISGLDPNQIKQIRSLIRELAKNRIIIYSSHLLSEVESNCDRAILIHNGRIIADESKEEFIRTFSPSNEVIVRFKNPISLKELSSETKEEFQMIDSSTYSARISKGSDTLQEKLFYFASKRDNPILSLYEKQPDMMEIFSELTEATS